MLIHCGCQHLFPFFMLLVVLASIQAGKQYSYHFYFLGTPIGTVQIANSALQHASFLFNF